MSRTSRFTDDPKGVIAFHLRRLVISIHTSWSTSFTRLKAWSLGVSIGRGLLCRGIPYFEKAPHSKIKLGDQCSILSSFRSNHIGIPTRSRIVTMSPDSKVIIGNQVGMSGVTITAHESITIDDKALIGAGTLITDSDWHAIDPELRHTEIGKTAPVHIGRNVLVGTRCIILKGVTIGADSVIGAGSVVTHDIPAGVIAAGNPCRVIKSLR